MACNRILRNGPGCPRRHRSLDTGLCITHDSVQEDCGLRDSKLSSSASNPFVAFAGPARLHCSRIAIPIAFRLYYLAPHSFDSRSHPEDLFTQTILCFAIVLASATCLKPVLKPFDQATFGSYATSTAISKYTLERDATKSACYELSDTDPRKRPGSDPQVSRASRPEATKQRKYVIEEDEIPLNNELQSRSHRGDAIGYGSHVVSQNESEDNSGNGIRKDISWSVRTFEEEDGVGARADRNAISSYRI